MDSVTLLAPAKINLFLKVAGRRPDGYHNIETLFEKIALSDTITLKRSGGGISISSDTAGLPLDERNLAYKAVLLLQKMCKKDLGVSIKIEKSIPIGAGLGGGSSDAAATLVGTNRLYGLGVSTDQLRELAAQIGADVPFFLSKSNRALGTARGDIIEEINIDLKAWYLLVLPDLEVSAKEAYDWVDAQTLDKKRNTNRALAALKNRDTDSLAKEMYNDLEGLALKKIEGLRSFKDSLVKNGAGAAIISGSGPALFGIFKNEGEVTEAGRSIMKETASRPGWRVAVASTLTN